MSFARMKITQEHIDAGVQGDCNACPIALAAQELFEEEVSVGDNGLWAEGREGWPRLAHPNQVMIDFMRDFDFDFKGGVPILSMPFETDIELTDLGVCLLKARGKPVFE